MKYGFVLPYGDARTTAELASEAEQAGWDGFFVWEPVWGIDAWVSLTAAAMKTTRIRLGTLLSPISRMRPWKLASETATLDNLSSGRVVLSVGLGAVDTGFEEFGEVTDRVERAELVDEALEVILGLWRGQPFNYDGKHYTIRETKFYPPPPPIQKPRIPIWVVGAWPRMKSMRRVLKYDGILPTKMVGGKHVKVEPEDIRAIKSWIGENRSETTPFDIVVEGKTPGGDSDDRYDIVHPWLEAGATWWIEAMWDTMDKKNGDELVAKRIRQGPPKI
ncbi:Alkanesulfonate monooxygenase [subsurface metagenome]